MTSPGSVLTAEQIEELPEGTPISVIWSGGNGPHDYLLHHDAFGSYAAPNPPYEDADVQRRMEVYNPLRFIGDKQFHTRVWLAGTTEPPPVR